MFLPAEAAPEYLTKKINDKNGFEGLLEFPSYVYLEPTPDCNARCRMCAFAHNSGRFMPQSLFDKCAAEIIENKKYVKYAVLQGRGEPLLYPGLAERIKIFTDAGIDTFMSTNASLLDEQKAEDLLKAGLKTIVLSLDSLDKTVYEKIRRGLDFDIVLKNIENYIKLRDRIDSSLQVRLRIIEQKYNRDEFESYEAFWKPRLKPHDRITVKKVHSWGGKLKISDIKNISSEQAFFPCAALWSYFAVLWDGSVPLCSADGAAELHSTGNVYNSSIKEIWHGKQLAQYREAHLSGNKIPSDICSGCRIFEDPSDTDSFTKKFFPELYEPQGAE